MTYSGNTGRCSCAACTLKRQNEKALHNKVIMDLQNAIDRGEFDHLKPKSNEEEGEES